MVTGNFTYFFLLNERLIFSKATTIYLILDVSYLHFANRKMFASTHHLLKKPTLRCYYTAKG
nr:MAG TPA: hypothetical protein [Caudoviricetes sp.]